MSKSFEVLSAILVCALAATAGYAKTLESTNSLSSGEVLTTELRIKVNVAESVSASKTLTTADLTAAIADANHLLSLRADPFGLPLDSVMVAALDLQTSQLNMFSLAKDEFLKKDADLTATTQFARKVNVHILRANGVNTAITVTDAQTKQPLLPLTVKYPISKKDGTSEVAYYTSAHPALLTPALTVVGQSYVRTMLNEAAENLAADGFHIPADIVDVAEHLCIVEHTDHKRFISEDQNALFPEILSLYALNRANTFRYSVSTAGAGGMIQMIPQTYEVIRQQYPNVALATDFVGGMRDHANALKAMLLYMNDTWSRLAKSSEVQTALQTGVATKAELLAAGYNSNPIRLPNYLKNGGADWRTLIPAETQMYLAIYGSIDKHLVVNNKPVAGNGDLSRLSIEPTNLTVFSWIGQLLVTRAASSVLP